MGTKEGLKVNKYQRLKVGRISKSDNSNYSLIFSYLLTDYPPSLLSLVSSFHPPFLIPYSRGIGEVFLLSKLHLLIIHFDFILTCIQYRLKPYLVSAVNPRV